MHDHNAAAGPQRQFWKRPAIVTAVLLLIPLLGNWLIDGWNWGLPGFLLFGTLVFGAALTFEVMTRNARSNAYRIGVAVALAAAFVLLWMNRVQAADGVDPRGLLFFAVPVVGIAGIAIARLRPAGMSRALFAAALAQALILGFVLITWKGEAGSASADALRAFGLNAFVLALFISSALLFRSAASDSV